MQITKNFKLEEFASGPVSGIVENNIRALAMQLQKLRDHFGAPIKILKGLSPTGSTEQKVGSGAVFTVSGKNGDQVKAALESLINQGQIINGTIGLFDKNHVYFALTPIGQRFDKRSHQSPPYIPVPTRPSEPEETPSYPRTTEKAKNLTALAMLAGLFVVGTIVFKRKKK